LMHRLSLTAPAEHWAEAVFASLARRAVSRAEALAAMQASRFDIAQSVWAFSRLYEGEC
jgi:hypothetical protein